MGLAKGFEVGIVEGELFHVVVQFDGFADIGLGGRKVASLCGIASQIELDEWIFRVKAGRIRKDFGGCFDGVAAAFCESPSDKPAGLIRMAGGETSGQCCCVLPTARPFKKAEFEFLDPGVGGDGGRKGFQFFQGIRKHPQVGVAHGAFSMPEIFS